MNDYSKWFYPIKSNKCKESEDLLEEAVAANINPDIVKSMQEYFDIKGVITPKQKKYLNGLINDKLCHDTDWFEYDFRLDFWENTDFLRPF